MLKETEESLDNYTDISDEKSNLERQEKTSKKPGLIFLIALAATAVYVLIGLIADNWTLTLAIFPLGAFLSILIIFYKAKKKNLIYGMIWTAAAALYLFISFISDGWAWSWVLFILALGAHEIVRRNLK